MMMLRVLLCERIDLERQLGCEEMAHINGF